MMVRLYVGHFHAVLGQCAGLVGANNGYGSHCLAGMQLSHQVVGAQHAPHVEGQTQGDGHGKSLGNGHDDERNGYHEPF